MSIAPRVYREKWQTATNDAEGAGRNVLKFRPHCDRKARNGRNEFRINQPVKRTMA